MQKIYKEININYEYYKNNSNTYMIFLHGWGQNIQMMMPLATRFLKKHNVKITNIARKSRFIDRRRKKTF